MFIKYNKYCEDCMEKFKTYRSMIMVKMHMSDIYYDRSCFTCKNYYVCSITNTGIIHRMKNNVLNILSTKEGIIIKNNE